MTRFRLERVDGGRGEKIFEGEANQPVAIGRSEKERVVLRDPSVSKQHASIEQTADGLLLRDVGSLNGTRRGTQKVGEKGVILADGDELRLGQTVLRIHLLDAPSPPPPPSQPQRRRPEVQRDEPPPEPPGRRPEAQRGESSFKEMFGSYGIVRDVETEGAAVTALAIDGRTQARVALKRIPSGSFGWFAVKGFLRACESAARIEHENLVAPRDSGKVGNAVFVASPYVDGVSVETLLRDAPKEVTIELALHIACGIARGLAHVEQAGLDVRPEVTDRRVFLTGAGQAVLVGVGVPFVGDRDRAAARYRAPEEDGGKKGDARAAVFSLGVLLYELLAREPIDAAQKARLRAIEAVRIDVSEALGGATMRALRVRPEARYDSAAEFEAELAEELQRLNPRFGAEEVQRWVVRRYPDVRASR